MIQQQLVARLEHLQFERLARAEAIADRLSDEVSQTIRVLLTIPATDSQRPAAAEYQVWSQFAARAAQVLTGLPDRLTAIADREFRQLAEWSHHETVNVFVQTLPRPWFRAISSAVLLAGKRLPLPDDPSETRSPGADEPLGGVEAFGDHPLLLSELTDDQWELWVHDELLPAPSDETISEILRQPVAGLTYEQRFHRLKNIIQPRQTALILEEGKREGWGEDRIRQEALRQIDRNVRSHIRRIGRTEGLRVANAAQRVVYDQAGGLVSGTEIRAQFDSGTRPEHGERHGRVYHRDPAQRFNYSNLPLLPDAPNCRCFHVPVIDSPPDFLDDPEFGAVFRTANGDTIADPVEYDKWYRQTDELNRSLAVGWQRYAVAEKRLQGQRRPEWSDFIRPDGSLLSIQDLVAETDLETAERRVAVLNSLQSRARVLRDLERSGHLLGELEPAMLQRSSALFLPNGAGRSAKRKGPHVLSAQHLRDGRLIKNFDKVVSGGTEGRKSWREQLLTHTERKVLHSIQHLARTGDYIEMRGQLNPCRPGCQPAMRQFADNQRVVIKYLADTGKTFTIVPLGSGRLKGAVLQQELIGGLSWASYRYWQTSGGNWIRARIRPQESEEILQRRLHLPDGLESMKSGHSDPAEDVREYVRFVTANLFMDIRGTGENPAELTRNGERLGFRIPNVLRAFHELIGQHNTLMASHARFYLASDFYERNGAIVFVQNREGNVFFGIRREDADDPDPYVYQGNPAEDVWHRENQRLSSFLKTMFSWNALNAQEAMAGLEESPGDLGPLAPYEVAEDPGSELSVFCAPGWIAVYFQLSPSINVGSPTDEQLQKFMDDYNFVMDWL